jgi:hypothetical protein
MTYNAYSTDERERLAPNPGDLPHEERRAPTASQRPAAPGSDGIKAFMMKFAASAKPETVAPATRDFIKASAFLFRK